MTKLSTVTVGAGGVASVTFSNIPQGYTDLKVVASARSDRGGEFTDYISILPNASTSNLSSRFIFFSNTTRNSSTDNRVYVATNSSTSTTNTYGSAEFYIPNYTSSNYKSIMADGVTENNSTSNYGHVSSGLWSSNAAITSLTLVSLNGVNWVANSTFSLYGIKNAAKTAGNSIKATGGDIQFDGTYVYHVFDATSTFVVNQPLLADVVSVGGGGGGGWNNAGGGGGGEVDIVNNLYLSANSSNTVTIGAGGATATSTSSAGGNGTTTSFASLVTSLGGGGGGTGDASAGLRVGQVGGSGGGGSLDNAGGGASGSNTNVGATGFAAGAGPERYAGGGGGGATSAGGNANTSTRVSGAGGQGYPVASLFTGFNLASLTHLGSGGSGGIYVNGDSGTAGTAGTNAGTGGQQTSTGNVNPTNPTINGGGGGGGGSYTSVNSRQGSNGASGIIVVRYKG
jgi:hypothetical protein